MRGAHLIGSAALAVILFDGGLRTDRRAFRVGLYPASTLATVGVAITAALTNFSWQMGIGAVVGIASALVLGATVTHITLKAGYRVDLDSPIVKGSPTHVEWPGETRPIVAIRPGRAVDADQITTFESGDQIYLLARPADLDWLDRKIVGERDPERLGERQFFGEFLIKPSAALAPLADIYGFKVDAETGALGVGDYLLRRYPKPVIGDWLRLEPVEFVVRETDGDRITKVGLKLTRP